MSNRMTAMTVRADLTQYAFGLMQDLKKALALADILAPIVPTGGTTGNYNKFDTTQAFKQYAASVARRAVGGHATEVGLLSDVGTYSAQPYGLRTKIDQHERDQAGESVALLEQSKVRTLQINSVVAYLGEIITLVKAGVSAATGKGLWLNADVDPIKEINEQIKAVFLATGIVPNKIVFDFGAWCVFADNPKVLARMPGADVSQVSPDRIKKLFVNPNAEVEIVETAVNTGGSLGNSAATKVSVMGGSVFVCYNSSMATPYDPSFCKTFSPSGSLFTSIGTYREEPHFDWFENDWTCQPVLVSSALCKRIDVTGANS